MMSAVSCKKPLCRRALLRHSDLFVFGCGEWAIIHRCKRCGKLSSNRVAADDNPMKLMSIAMKPLCAPPFPLDYLEKMTALMGGDGRMR